MHPHIGEQHRAVHAARHNAAARHHGLDRHAATVIGVMDKLGGWELGLVGPNGPLGVVQVELGLGGCQVDIGIPVRVNRADIAPVGFVFGRIGHAAHGERVGGSQAVTHRAGDDVLAEIVAGRGVCHVALEFGIQESGVKYIDAHAGQRHVGVAGHGWWIGGFFQKLCDQPVLVDGHHPECGGFGTWHRNATHCAFTPLGHVVGQHQGVIHLVNVVACQHHDVVGSIAFQDVVVLVDRVGRAPVPVFVVVTLLCG